MKVELCATELWPVLDLKKSLPNTKSDFIIEVSEETYADFLKAMEEFNKIQNILMPLYEECRTKEELRYLKMNDQMNKKLMIEEYTDEQYCGKCNRKQKRGIYQGGQYIGCEECSSIKTSITLRTNLLEDAIGL